MRLTAAQPTRSPGHQPAENLPSRNRNYLVAPCLPASNGRRFVKGRSQRVTAAGHLRRPISVCFRAAPPHGAFLRAGSAFRVPASTKRYSRKFSGHGRFPLPSRPAASGVPVLLFHQVRVPPEWSARGNFLLSLVGRIGHQFLGCNCSRRCLEQLVDVFEADQIRKMPFLPKSSDEPAIAVALKNKLRRGCLPFPLVRFAGSIAWLLDSLVSQPAQIPVDDRQNIAETPLPLVNRVGVKASTDGHFAPVTNGFRVRLAIRLLPSRPNCLHVRSSFGDNPLRFRVEVFLDFGQHLLERACNRCVASTNSRRAAKQIIQGEAELSRYCLVLLESFGVPL